MGPSVCLGGQQRGGKEGAKFLGVKLRGQKMVASFFGRRLDFFSAGLLKSFPGKGKKGKVSGCI